MGTTAAGGVIRRMPNVVKFREDPDAMLVLSLNMKTPTIYDTIRVGDREQTLAAREKQNAINHALRFPKMHSPRRPTFLARHQQNVNTLP